MKKIILSFFIFILLGFTIASGYDGRIKQKYYSSCSWSGRNAGQLEISDFTCIGTGGVVIEYGDCNYFTLSAGSNYLNINHLFCDDYEILKGYGSPLDPSWNTSNGTVNYPFWNPSLNFNLYPAVTFGSGVLLWDVEIEHPTVNTGSTSTGVVVEVVNNEEVEKPNISPIILMNLFASIMWIAGAFLVCWFIDVVVDFFLSLFRSY